MKRLKKHKQKLNNGNGKKEQKEKKKQRTESKQNRKIMKNMKTKLITSVALAACMGTQAFAASTTLSKEDTITFALTLQGQKSVSTSPTALDAGNFSQKPRYYKTVTQKVTEQNLIKCMGQVLGTTFSSKAKLVLVQGELSGFFNVVSDVTPRTFLSYDDSGIFYGMTNGTDVGTGPFLTGGATGSSRVGTTLPDQTVTFFTLDNGRHYQTYPWTDTATVTTNIFTDTNGVSSTNYSSVPNIPAVATYPVGHFQPWGQLFIKDPAQPGFSVDNPYCVNVTYFFNLEVEECYDCFYMNSFISDASFTSKGGGVGFPACCGVGSTVVGNGTDKYYLKLKFDDTIANQFLDPNNINGAYVGYQGIIPDVAAGDDINNDLDGLPDNLPYSDPIASDLGSPSPYEARFQLNGIMTYKWALKNINASDVLPDFIGTGTYVANGFGYIQLDCMLVTAGTVTFTEKAVNYLTCCNDIPWQDSWFGIGWDGDSSDVVWETDAPGLNAGTWPTSQENVSLSLTYHNPDWPGTPVSY